MEMFVSPAGLIAVMSCMVLTGWTLGRWQGGARRIPSAVPVFNDTRALSHLPDTQISRAETAANAMSLCDLHAEVTAFRRRERVLASVAPDALHLGLPSVAALGKHNWAKTHGASHCPILESSAPVCICGADCGRPLRAPSVVQIKVVQPSPGWSPLTRV